MIFVRFPYGLQAIALHGERTRIAHAVKFVFVNGILRFDERVCCWHFLFIDTKAEQAERRVMAQVFVIGRVTADFEIQLSTNHIPYVRFTLAENIGYGEHAKTQFFQVWAWSDDAKRLVRSKVKKGSLLWISGSLELEEYQKQDETINKRLKVLLDNWGFVAAGSKTISDGSLPSQTDAGSPCEPEAELQPEEIDGDRDHLPE